MNKSEIINDYCARTGDRPFTASRSLTPAKQHEYPRTIHGRVFATEAEYNEALAEFMNGN